MTLSAPALWLLVVLNVLGFAYCFVYRRREARRCGAALHNPRHRVDARRRAMLTLGAPLTAHWRVYVDSLETGRDLDGLRGILRRSWRVEDGVSFRRNIATLLTHGAHHPGFDLALHIYSAYPREEWNHVAAAHGADPSIVRGQIDRLHAVLPMLEEAGIGDASDAARSVVAWDVGRLVALTRAAYDCGYIPSDEAWGLIERAYEQACAAYQSWREVATSYAIGRALWGGDDESLEHFIDVSARMLCDPRSAFCTTSFA